MNECPLAASDDKFGEAHYFLHQMAVEYHEPAKFRYCLNAYLSSLKSVIERVRSDLERSGKAQWMKQNKDALVYSDPVLKSFFKGRDIVVHRKEISEGSRVDTGIFRGRKMKLIVYSDVKHDRSSYDLLRHLQNSEYGGMILDAEHAAFWEQLGVRRTYNIPVLSSEEDAFTASARALVRISRLMQSAHEQVGHTFEEWSEEAVGETLVSEINLLLETDLDPDAIYRWGWVEREQD